jgi:hypothetical protein
VRRLKNRYNAELNLVLWSVLLAIALVVVPR